MTIWKTTVILKIKLKNYMKKRQKAKEKEANVCSTKKVRNHQNSL